MVQYLIWQTAGREEAVDDRGRNVKERHKKMKTIENLSRQCYWHPIRLLSLLQMQWCCQTNGMECLCDLGCLSVDEKTCNVIWQEKNNIIKHGQTHLHQNSWQCHSHPRRNPHHVCNTDTCTSRSGLVKVKAHEIMICKQAAHWNSRSADSIAI